MGEQNGLGVNIDKTSVIRIRSMRISDRILCNDYELNLVKDKFFSIRCYFVYEAAKHFSDEF